MVDSSVLPDWVEALRGDPSPEEQAGDTPALQRRFMQRMLVRAMEQQAAATAARIEVDKNTRALNSLQHHLGIRARELAGIEGRIISSVGSYHPSALAPREDLGPELSPGSP